MYLREVANKAFALMHADWTVAQAKSLLKRTDFSHVIIVCRESGATYYYLYDRRLLPVHFQRVRDNQISLRDVLNLHETNNQAADAYQDHTSIQGGAVVLEEGRVIGFYEAAEDNPDLRNKRAMSGPATPAAAATVPVPRRLLAEFPEQVQLNATVALTVTLTGEQSEGAAALPLALTVGETITILVEARRGFVVQGNNVAQITVGAAEDSPRQLFMLQANELGVGKVRISAFRQGQEIGSMEVVATVEPVGQPVTSGAQSHSQSLSQVRIQSPDLSLEIREQVSNGETSIMVYLNAVEPHLGLNWAPFGPVKLRTSPLAYFQEFFKDIEDLPLSSDTERKIAERRLSAKGSLLFSTLFPPDLQVLLWSVRQQIKSVQVQSDEPWIPWELCKLEGKENGEDVAGPFLCEVFALTRWIPGVPLKPTLKLKRIGLVVPESSGLTFAKDEQEYILSLATPQRQVEAVPAKYLELTDALATGSYDGWHFTGHGSFRDTDPNGSGMELDDNQKLRPDDLSDTSIKKLGKAKPLVFLNACQLGRSALTLTDIGGWAGQFLRANAAAFIGAYWSIYDDIAFQFANKFYSGLIGGLAVGQAAQEARLAVKQGGDPTWLAYTVYAHPLATLTSD